MLTRGSEATRAETTIRRLFFGGPTQVNNKYI